MNIEYATEIKAIQECFEQSNREIKFMSTHATIENFGAVLD